MEIDLTVAGGQYQCISSYATGNVKNIVANVIFNSTDTTSTVDLLFVVKYLNAPLGNCIQIGGSVERCNNLFAWPDDWNEDAVNGQLYTANIDVSAATYNWPEGQYQFCFGNSDPTSGYDSFLGTVAVQDLIGQPSVFEVSSEAGETLAVDFNIDFGATDYACIDGYAYGTVNKFNATVTFSSTNPDQISLGFVAVIKYAGATEQGNCIQVGGTFERCANYFVWPSTWYTDAQNGQKYTAVIDVSSANYNWPIGDYKICLGNSDTTNAYVTFAGELSFPDLITQTPPPIAVSSSYGEILAVDVNAKYKGGEYSCVSSYATGPVHFINASIFFTRYCICIII